MDSVKKILTHLSGRQVEIFYILLISSGKYTFLPELYDIFGRENTIKFLEVFSGCKFYIPKLDKLRTLARKAEVYIRVEKVPKKQQASVIKTLAEEFEVSEDWVMDIYLETKLTIEEQYGFKVLKKKKKSLEIRKNKP